MAEPLRIGVLRGREDSLPNTLIEKINSMKAGVVAEFAQLGGTSLSEPCPYRVVLDRISHEVPYYQVYLKQISMQGTYVCNNPFMMHVDDKFFGYSLANKLGIPCPKTVVLPNREYIPDITAGSLRNLWPIDWEARLREVGLPCYMKPAFGGGWKNVHKIRSIEEAVHVWENSGQLTMMLQEGIEWEDYIRCITIGRKYTRPCRYIPRPGGMGEYVQDLSVVNPKWAKTAEEYSIRFCEAIGYDMNALEWAVRDGELYAIDINNYVCDMDYRSLRDAHFPWAIEHMAKFLVETAKSGATNSATCDWSKLKTSARTNGKTAPAPAKKEKVKV
ncbi:MAG: ATP-grasp domain-containing protein [Candidatus Xenobia bacterium]